MKKAVLFVLFSLLITTVAEATKDYKMSIYEAINRAGYQRMLTQRIAKCYLTIVVNIDSEKNRKYLAGSVKVFEENLKKLSSYAPTLQIGKQFDRVEQLWADYRTIYTKAFTVDNAAIMLDFSNEILTACNEAVLLLEAYAAEQEQKETPEILRKEAQLSRIISISGQQRMLSQRILLYTLAINYDLGDQSNNLEHLNKAMTTFKKGYSTLVAYPQNNQETDAQLALILKEWLLLERELLLLSKLEKENSDATDGLLKALNLSEKILFASDELVFLYQRLQG